jgi:hypothetical protein
VKVAKQRDGETGAAFGFTLDKVLVGQLDDGSAMTSCVFVAGADVAVKGRAKVELKPVLKAALRALHECMADGITAPVPNDHHVPVGIKGITAAQWRERLERLSIINAKGNPREQFRRIHVALKNLGRIGTWDDFVWPSQVSQR